MYYVYVLQWEDIHYVWITNNLSRRLEEHKRSKKFIITKLGNFCLLWYFEKPSLILARELEKKIKKNGHIDFWINHVSFIRGP